MVVIVRGSVIPGLRNVRSTTIVSAACGRNAAFTSIFVVALAPGAMEPTSVVRTELSCQAAVHTDCESPSHKRPGVRLRVSEPSRTCVVATLPPENTRVTVKLLPSCQMVICGPKPGAEAGFPVGPAGASAGRVQTPLRFWRSCAVAVAVTAATIESNPAKDSSRMRVTLARAIRVPLGQMRPAGVACRNPWNIGSPRRGRS